MLQSIKNPNTIDLFWILFRTDFKLRYNDSLLGFIWVLMKPFSIFLILYYVLTSVFPSMMPYYGLYLLIGNVFYSFWSEGTNQGLESLLSRASLITKLHFPRYIVLFSSTALSVVNFLINSIIIAIFLIYQGIYPSFLQIAWYFFCAIVLYFIIITVSLYTSIAYVRFRDLKQIWDLFLQLTFWLTPVVYSHTFIKEKGLFLEQILLWINPVSVTLISSRSAVIYLDIQYQLNVFVILFISIIAFVVGYFYYKRAIKKIAEFF